MTYMFVDDISANCQSVKLVIPINQTSKATEDSARGYGQ